MDLTAHGDSSDGNVRQAGVRKVPDLEPPYLFGPALLDALPSAAELGVTEEMMEAAEAICADVDRVGIETWRLEVLVRLIVYLVRR